MSKRATEQTLFEIELAVEKQDHNTAAQLIHEILIGFRKGHHFGKLYDMDRIDPNLTECYTRLARCITELFLHCSGYRISPAIFLMWMIYAREFRAVFIVSGYYNTNYIIGLLDKKFNEAIAENNKGIDRIADIEQLILRILLFSMLENAIQVNLDTFYGFAQQVTMISIISLMSSTVMMHEGATARREALLNHLTKLDTCDLPDNVNLLDLSVVYMMCSYLSSNDKHQIKRQLNSVVRKWIERNGLHKLEPKAGHVIKGKPVMLLPLEFFRANHSMGRSYGEVLKSLRSKFYTVGIALQEGEKDDSNYEYFDKVITLDCVREDGLICEHKVRSQIKKLLRLNPDVIYFPSLGMHIIAVILSNLRLAPVQIIGCGHPASSFCDTIDYCIVEEDYLPLDSSYHSEKLIAVPAESALSTPLATAQNFVRKTKKPSDTLLIAISAVTPKISSRLLLCCRKIQELSKRSIRFIFLVNDMELFYLQAKKEILNIVPNAEVYPRMPADTYIQYLASCDIYLSSFPFGGANSVDRKSVV